MAVELETYLSQQRPAGRTTSGQGFSVDYARARKFLARLRLPRTTDYLLKLVQGGVRADCSWVGVKLGTSIEVLWLGYRRFEPQGLVPALCRPLEGDQSSAVSALACAVEAVTALGGRVVICQPDAGRMTTFEGDRVAVELCEREAVVPHPALRITVDLPRRRRHLRGERALIRECCSYSRVQVLLDGQDLRETYWSRHQAGPNRWILGERRLGDGPTATLSLPPLPEPAPLVWSLDGARHGSGWLVLRGGLEPLARVKLVQAGVVIETRRLDLGVPGIEAVMAADHLPTDLTGMQVRDTEAFAQALESLRQAAHELRDEVLEALDEEAAATLVSLEVKPRLVGWLALLVLLGSLFGCTIWTEPLARAGLIGVSALTTLLAGLAQPQTTLECRQSTPLEGLRERLRKR